MLPDRQCQQGKDFARDAWLGHRRTQQEIDEAAQHTIAIGDDAANQGHTALIDHGDVILRLGAEIETHGQAHVERLLLAPTLAARLAAACCTMILLGFAYHAPTLFSVNSMTENLIVFAHGKESGPWGIKIKHLAKTAERRGFDVISPDYRHTQEPQARIEQLIALQPQARRLVLAGSSMGGYVSAMACARLRPQALFLMAPAVHFPFAGWDGEPQGIPKSCTVVHGWHDDIVPLAQAQRFAKKHSAALHVLDADHSLNDQLPMLDLLLGQLLDAVLAG